MIFPSPRTRRPVVPRLSSVAPKGGIESVTLKTRRRPEESATSRVVNPAEDTYTPACDTVVIPLNDLYRAGVRVGAITV